MATKQPHTQQKTTHSNRTNTLRDIHTHTHTYTHTHTLSTNGLIRIECLFNVYCCCLLFRLQKEYKRICPLTYLSRLRGGSARPCLPFAVTAQSTANGCP